MSRRPKLHTLTLSARSRAALERMANEKSIRPQRRKRAKVLLLAAAPGPHRISEIAKAAGVAAETVSSVLQEGASWLKTVRARDAAHRLRMAYVSRLPVPIIPERVRASLERLAEETVLQPFQARHARALLLASACKSPLPVDRLTREAGLSYPTLWSLLRDPEKSLRKLLQHDETMPIPPLTPEQRRSLELITRDQADRSPAALRARVLLVVAGRRGLLKAWPIARASGVSDGLVKRILADPARALRIAEMPAGTPRPLRPGRHSLAQRRPGLVRQWDLEKNLPLTPENISWKSMRKIWWRCRKGPDHAWRAPLWNMSRKGAGCPFCFGRRLSVTNSFAARFPKLAAQWHPKRNGILRPENIRASSHRLVWWRCSRGPDHEWQTQVLSRTLYRSGCSFCSNQRVSVTNSLAARYPILAKQWHPTKNGALRPDQVVFGSNRHIWWRCLRNPAHVWLTTVRARSILGNGCRKCRKW